MELQNIYLKMYQGKTFLTIIIYQQQMTAIKNFFSPATKKHKY